MNKYLNILFLAFFLCQSCSQEEQEMEKGTSLEIQAELPGYVTEGGTRIALSSDLQSMTWSSGDKLGLYYIENEVEAGAWFKIKQGGSQIGVFENSAFMLKKNTRYYSFFPYQEEVNLSAIPVDYSGQIQTANESTSHLGAYNYMCGSFTSTASGDGNVTFANIGAVMQVQLVPQNNATFTQLTIQSDATQFVIKGTVDVKTGTITPTATQEKLTLSLGSGIPVEVGNALTVNILLAPVDLSTSHLSFTLKDSLGNQYVVTQEGKTILRGKVYHFAGFLPSLVEEEEDVESGYEGSSSYQGGTVG